MRAMIIIIDIGGCVELNKVSPKIQSLLTFFFIFVLVSFLPILTYQVSWKSSHANFVATLFSILPRISTEGRIFWVALIIFWVVGIWTFNSHFYLNFKCPISFAFPSVSSRELLFLTWRSGGPEWAIDVLMKMTGMRVIGLKMKTDTLIVLCGILMTCG